MSLETKKPSVKTQRQKVPTRQELMKAFQDLRNEILEDKGLDEVTEEEIEESEKSSKESARSVTEDKENERGGLPDPSRWQTIVYNGQHKVIDLKLIEPYMKVLTHGGNDILIFGWHNTPTKQGFRCVELELRILNKGVKQILFYGKRFALFNFYT